jgi:hypothetical protein
MKTSLPQLTPPAFGVSKSELKALRKQAVKTNNTALLADLRRAKDTLIPQRRQLTRDIHRITGRYKKGFETGQLLYYPEHAEGSTPAPPIMINNLVQAKTKVAYSLAAVLGGLRQLKKNLSADSAPFELSALARATQEAFYRITAQRHLGLNDYLPHFRHATRIHRRRFNRRHRLAQGRQRHLEHQGPIHPNGHLAKLFRERGALPVGSSDDSGTTSIVITSFPQQHPHSPGTRRWLSAILPGPVSRLTSHPASQNTSSPEAI